MNMYFLAFDGSIKLTNSGNYLDQEYSEILREKLLEGLTCFTHSFNTENARQKFL